MDFAKDIIKLDGEALGLQRGHLYNNLLQYNNKLYSNYNFDHVLGVVSQTRVSGGNRTHDPHTNSLAHYPLD